MSSGNNNFNNNNALQRRFPFIVTPEQYAENQRWIENQTARFAELNRTGLQVYMTAQAELQRRIAEGEQARQQMQYLQQLASTRTITAAASQTSVPPQYGNIGYVANTQPAAIPPSFTNISGVSPINMQGSYAANSVSLDSPVAIDQVPPLSGGQQGHDIGQVFQQGPSQASRAQGSSINNHPQANQGQQYNTQPQQVAARINYANTTSSQLPANQNLARGQTYISKSDVYMQRQQETTPAGSRPSNSHLQGRQGAPSYTYSAGQPSYFANVPSTSGSSSGSNARTSFNIPSSNSSSALAGALSENSTVQPSRGNVTRPDPWTEQLNQSRSRIETTTNPGHVQTTRNSVAIAQHRSLSGEPSLPHTATPQPAPVPYPANKLDQTRAELTEILRDHVKSLDRPEKIASSRGTISGIPPSNGSQSIQPTSIATHPAHPTFTISQSNFPCCTVQSAVQPTTFAHGVQGMHGGPYPMRQSVPSSYPNVAGAINSNTLYAQRHAALMASTSGAGESHASSGLTALPNGSSTPTQASQDVGNVYSNGQHGTMQYMTLASADKKTLAKDILWALGAETEKRKSSTPTLDDDAQPPLHMHVVDPRFVGAGMMDGISTPISSFPVPEANVTARIEEIVSPPRPSLQVMEVGEASKVGEAVVLVPETQPLVNASSPAVDELAKQNYKDVLSSSDAPVPSGSSTPTPSRSVVESRASSEDVMIVDSALQPEDIETPLFLPSPESLGNTPSPSGPYAESMKSRIGGFASTSSQPLKGGQGKRGADIVVLVPRLTPAQIRLFHRKEPVEEESVEEGSPLVVQSRDSPNEAGSTSVADAERLRLAQRANDDAASRLRRRYCVWNDCSHIANNAISLKAHVLDHVSLIPAKEKILQCWWDECIRKFNKREALAQHLQNHVRRSIFCAYQGCKEHFTRSLGLLTHIENKHPLGSKMRPPVTPFAPSSRQIPTPLRVMFAYHDVNLPIQMARMSEERRARLGPWIAKNSFGAVNPGTAKLNARNQPQRRRPDDQLRVMGDWQDKYDFIEPFGATYPAHCADLESSEATQMIERGLVLAPDRAGPRGLLQEQLLTSRADRVKVKDSKEYVLVPDQLPSQGPEAEVLEVKAEEVSGDLSQDPVPLVTQTTDRALVYHDFLGVGEPQAVEQVSA